MTLVLFQGRKNGCFRNMHKDSMSFSGEADWHLTQGAKIFKVDTVDSYDRITNPGMGVWRRWGGREGMKDGGGWEDKNAFFNFSFSSPKIYVAFRLRSVVHSVVVILKRLCTVMSLIRWPDMGADLAQLAGEQARPVGLVHWLCASYT